MRQKKRRKYVEKWTETLDTPPSMLYNVIAMGKRPAIGKT